MHEAVATRIFTCPVAAAEGVLELRAGHSVVAVRATAIDTLVRARFDGPAPRTHAEGARAVIEYPRFSLSGLIQRVKGHAEIELNAAVPWSLLIRGGIAGSVLDLRRLELRGLDLDGGVSDLRILLPEPRGHISVRVRGGAGNVDILRPSGVAARLRIGGGASRLTFDGERYGAIGGTTELETQDARAGHDGYEIEIAGGASRLTVDERGSE